MLDISGTYASTLGQNNPIRYRGYYYDSETSLYYLNSRYYDPAMRRFINADDIDCLGINCEFVSFDLFSYCGNNPVTRSVVIKWDGRVLSMVDITEIMDMLDWNMSPEIQLEGISLARNIETIIPFIQPLTPKHNKNVWGNCAVIISERSDEEIKPHLPEVLEWLQDMNWPGAFCILDRLKNYSDKNSILSAISICIQKAKDCNDEIWEGNLLTLQRMLL